MLAKRYFFLICFYCKNRKQHRCILENPFYVEVSYTCFVCVEVLRPSQPNGVMSSAVSLPNHTFTGQA